jgi:uncharacterized protein YjbI with pentapeptide repeats
MSVDFHDSELQNSNLEGADFYEVNLRNANLEGASLRWANFYGATLMEANMSKTNFYHAALISSCSLLGMSCILFNSAIIYLVSIRNLGLHVAYYS